MSVQRVIDEALEVKLEEDEEDFRSCCEDEDELKEREERVDVDSDAVRMYFKGVSVAGPHDSPGSRVSGVGVVLEKQGSDFPVRVQKKLDFYVEESVADYLALLDGLSVAIENDFNRVCAFTDSEAMHNQIIHDEAVESPLLLALRERIKEQSTKLETFVLKLAPSTTLQKASRLAQVAVGIVASPPPKGPSTETCSICCEERLSSMMLAVKCSHRFCSHCMKTYVEGKLQSVQVPIRCPQLNCKYRISPLECELFLPVASYESLEKAIEVLGPNKIHCPYPSCSVLLDPCECLLAGGGGCVECPVCRGFICVGCEVPWHSSMTCDEYQELPLEERDASDLTVHRLAQNERWRRCQQCRRMIELANGCYHMICECSHEFCYSCGVEYLDGEQICECAVWENEEYSEELVNSYPAQQLEQWAWDSFESLPMMMDAYSDQERSQLALIQRFLAGGFGCLTENQPDQSPPRCTDSYDETMKDLRQLPWLERFVSVISNDYYEDYIH